jgi:valyl-tRNA synthetase
VSRFVLNLATDAGDDADPADVTEPIDRSMLALLADLVDDATDAFDAFDYARALERTERFFWQFCDDYVELVKGRAYGGHGEAKAASASAALRLALSALQRMFAPFLPFVTEEVWSWWHDEGSVHRAAWPASAGYRAAAHDDGAMVFDVAGQVISAIRKAKSEQRRSLATPVTRAVVHDTEARLAAFDAARSDVCEAGKVETLETAEAHELAVVVELAPPES